MLLHCTMILLFETCDGATLFSACFHEMVRLPQKGRKTVKGMFFCRPSRINLHPALCGEYGNTGIQDFSITYRIIASMTSYIMLHYSKPQYPPRQRYWMYFKYRAKYKSLTKIVVPLCCSSVIFAFVIS